MKQHKSKQGYITLPKNNTRQWKLYQQVAEAVKDLDHLKDAAQVQQDNRRSAPPRLLPMVF